MPEHYTKNTLECTAWCAKCQRFTQHRVDEGRRGPCIDVQHPVRQLTKTQQEKQQRREKDKREPRLFQ